MFFEQLCVQNSCMPESTKFYYLNCPLSKTDGAKNLNVRHEEFWLQRRSLVSLLK